MARGRLCTVALCLVKHVGGVAALDRLISFIACDLVSGRVGGRNER